MNESKFSSNGAGQVKFAQTSPLVIVRIKHSRKAKLIAWWHILEISKIWKIFNTNMIYSSEHGAYMLKIRTLKVTSEIFHLIQVSLLHSGVSERGLLFITKVVRGRTAKSLAITWSFGQPCFVLLQQCVEEGRNPKCLWSWWLSLLHLSQIWRGLVRVIPWLFWYFKVKSIYINYICISNIIAMIIFSLGVKNKTKVIDNNLDPVWDEVKNEISIFCV